MMTLTVVAAFDFMPEPRTVGELQRDSIPGRGDRYRFTFDPGWLSGNWTQPLDNVTALAPSVFSRNLDSPFIIDSIPDCWGRTLIERRHSLMLRKAGQAVRTCTTWDFLVGVDDRTRMGAIRFFDEAGKAVSESPDSVPPLSQLASFSTLLRDYEENGVEAFWLDAFFSSSSSLGGARPKINVVDDDGTLWIAKLPALHDTYDVGLWEELVMRLARRSGIHTAQTMTIPGHDGRHVLLSRRFDRDGDSRIHMASAHCLLYPRTEDASFLDLAELVSMCSVAPQDDLHELFRRLVFFAAVNNTDNHLRNHAFLLTQDGWRLAPAYDINASVHGRASALAITEGLHELDMSLIKSLSPLFAQDNADEVVDSVLDAVSFWKQEARELGLGHEIPLMETAFAVG